VEIQCIEKESYNFTNYEWGYQVISFVLINLPPPLNTFEPLLQKYYILKLNASCSYVQVGLLGEKLQIYREENLGAVVWSKNGISMNGTLTWYKVHNSTFHVDNEKYPHVR
jgi:hypothetical protein